MIGANTKCATMKKYYTPDITEFYVEFEFEYRNNSANEWVRYDDFRVGDIQRMNNQTHQYRVKHLDREDIESLGFKESSSFGYNTFKREIVSGDNSDEYKICYISDDEPTSVVVLKANKAWVLGTSKWNPIFRGTIKNKSELKKLLKQLGI